MFFPAFSSKCCTAIKVQNLTVPMGLVNFASGRFMEGRPAPKYCKAFFINSVEIHELCPNEVFPPSVYEKYLRRLKSPAERIQ